MRANLHLHSKFSDGTQWPEEIAARAHYAGLELVALTDHDSMEGTPSFQVACERLGLRAVPGVEIDVTVTAPGIAYNSELLGYFPHDQFTRTQQFCHDRLVARQQSMEQYLRRAHDVFHLPGRVDLEEILVRKRGVKNARVADLQLALTKVDLFEYLVASKVLPAEINYKDFKKDPRIFGGTGSSPADIKPSIAEVTRLIQDDGGFGVLPHLGESHPDLLRGKKLPELDRLLAHARNAGVWGVEIYYYDDPDRDTINALVQQHATQWGFQFTFGTDCHGRGSRKDFLDKAWQDLTLPDWHLA